MPPQTAMMSSRPLRGAGVGVGSWDMGGSRNRPQGVSRGSPLTPTLFHGRRAGLAGGAFSALGRGGRSPLPSPLPEYRERGGEAGWGLVGLGGARGGGGG